MAARILLVDDHEVVRRGVKLLLQHQPEWEVCGEAQNGKEAIDQVVILKPDLVILDLSMPVMGGLEAAREIRRVSPGTKILIFTMHDSPRLAAEVERAGADGYVSKTALSAELQKTITILLASRN
jgi:DNA-binding NarL/FixJ family response regulator